MRAGAGGSRLAAPPNLASPQKPQVSSTPRNAKRLFEIGGSYLGDPGVVVGGEARFLLQGMNYAFYRRHLGVGKRGDALHRLVDRVHCAAIVALHAVLD